MTELRFPSARRAELGPTTSVAATGAYTVQINSRSRTARRCTSSPTARADVISPAPAFWAGAISRSARLARARSFVERAPLDHILFARNPFSGGRACRTSTPWPSPALPDDTARVANLRSATSTSSAWCPCRRFPTSHARPGGPAPPSGWCKARVPVPGDPAQLRRPAVRRKPLRQAFGAVLDREAIANTILRGAALPAYSCVSRSSTGTPGTRASSTWSRGGPPHSRHRDPDPERIQPHADARTDRARLRRQSRPPARRRAHGLADDACRSWQSADGARRRLGPGRDVRRSDGRPRRHPRRRGRVSVPLDMEDVTPATGNLADPTLATPERGRQLFEHAVHGCARFLRWFRRVDPYLGPGAPR